MSDYIAPIYCLKKLPQCDNITFLCIDCQKPYCSRHVVYLGWESYTSICRDCQAKQKKEKKK